MYSDYAAASPYPRSNYASTAGFFFFFLIFTLKILASPFNGHQGPSTVRKFYFAI